MPRIAARWGRGRDSNSRITGYEPVLEPLQSPRRVRAISCSRGEVFIPYASAKAYRYLWWAVLGSNQDQQVMSPPLDRRANGPLGLVAGIEPATR